MTLPRSDAGAVRSSDAELEMMLARAAAWIAGADRWPEARWADLEARRR
jgi:hypothetical protein